MPAGRPTKYDPKYCDEIINFMERTSHEIVVDKTYYKGDEYTGKTGPVKSETHKLIANTFPTLERFCHSIGIHKDTLIEWATAKDNAGNLLHEEFSDAYKRAKQIQEAILVENALQGTYAPNFAMFVAKNAFGWRDKSETELTGKDGTPLPQALIYLPDNKRSTDDDTQ